MRVLFPLTRRRTGGTILTVVLVLAAIGLGIALLLPAVRRAPEAARRNTCVNKMKQLVLALHNYHDVNKELPPAYTVDENGKPLHSWRTLILPFIEETTLYKLIDLSKPWNDPVNAKALNTVVDAFHCPSSPDADNHTNYVAILSEDSCLQPAQSLKFSEIADGTSKTIILVEVPAKHSVPWMAPEDISEAQFLEVLTAGTTNHSGGIFIVGIADGSVRTLTTDVDTGLLRALITASGNEFKSPPE